MFCRQARRKLDIVGWQNSKITQDQELLDHLRNCPKCYSLILAEEGLQGDFLKLSEESPAVDLALETVRLRTERSAESVKRTADQGDTLFVKALRIILPTSRLKLATGVIGLLLIVGVLVPFNYREQIGYQIAIDGVEKDISVENQKVTSLLGALGMEKDKATSIADSIGVSQVRLQLGQCTETCRLTISDLKTERDVRLMVKAIIDLGCCHIEDIMPVFRNESTNLLELAARKLLS